MTPQPKVLILFEQSAQVRDAFTAAGFLSASCDLYPSRKDGLHFHGDWRDCPWLTTARLIIAHPPCRYLTAAGTHLWKEHEYHQARAVITVRELWALRAPLLCIENPRGALSRLWRKPDQYIEPHWFGDNRKKKTGLWLRGLPHLSPTTLFSETDPTTYVTNVSNTRQRSFKRSITSPAIAKAMATQWGELL